MTYVGCADDSCELHNTPQSSKKEMIVPWATETRHSRMQPSFVKPLLVLGALVTGQQDAMSKGLPVWVTSGCCIASLPLPPSPLPFSVSLALSLCHSISLSLVCVSFLVRCPGREGGGGCYRYQGWPQPNCKACAHCCKQACKHCSTMQKWRPPQLIACASHLIKIPPP